MSTLTLETQLPGVRVQRRSRQVPLGPLLALIFLAFLIVAALLPQLFTHADPLTIVPHDAFHPPGWAHWFGTDQSGRDIFSRVIYGTRQSLLIGLAATVLAMSIAIALGLLGGLGGARLDRGVGWLLEILFAFPSLVLALLFVAVFGSGIGPLIVATGLGAAPGYARMVRGQVLAVRNAGYIEAAVALGHPTRRIILRQLLPNAMRPLIVTLTMGIGQAIVWASALSFLGLGAKPPAPEWGTMLSMGRDFVANAWWLTFFPGVFIVLTTLSTTVAGRYLQQRLEGRLS
ncbi:MULTISPECIES: ABC transporter permease [unclassified Pseudomonas]|uniref:ABC transporter permease n=1 Tax=unclassified Pseudomonas TaxID=196821 RepID=UPI0012957C99|nr:MULTISPECIES: ABC transporter permease [unclassified Pseudomonas]MQT44913.1 ABC transporter permease subunit [Pseudomonas sp. FSL R10-0765]MQT53543.1 ABC transporter permease subunit [Pseudomonas sp. FSL R10-2398]MQU01221.1 ABC transporter permease subunit [Pseudomonas sp. FSL R10-2245]MQU13614.1 ABC transporter permease subunit [Pseudomonas sp. FSL R10-2189]MQU38412.1 ABC transporter permease subunit [Pseudomonas sp. FSL R10-2172]